MLCHFVDDRTEFFAILSEKIGSEIEFVPCSVDREQFLSCDIIIVGLHGLEHPDFHSGLSTLQRIASNPRGVPVVAFLPTNDRQLIRLALNAGAYDYFGETGPMDELRLVLRRAAQFHDMHREVQRLRDSAADGGDFSSLVGTDQKMRAIFAFCSKVASTDATVLISGETGTGKEQLARAMHQGSPRAHHPFIAVACASLPESLIEAELFGHEKGAFTGAVALRRGRFEAAERGTIFLDEIGELTPGLQVKLLRVLQERTFERLGSNHARPMEARVICATHRNLSEQVKAGLFRPDLYYRLNTIEVQLPTLRERRDDIVLLAHTFLQTYAEKHKRPARRFATAALAALQEYDWPGNVRELQNVIERAVVISDGPEVRMEHLPSQFTAWVQEDSCSFDDEVRRFKRRLIQRTLAEFGNNKLQAARSLKIARSSLHRLIDELQIPASPEGWQTIH
jgi:DNA-binding NtrC family response regulator